MEDNLKSGIKPLLTSIGLLGVTSVTTIFGGGLAAGAFGIAGKVAYDLISNIVPNIASDQLLKIKPNQLRKYFTSGIPNLSNHDLYKGFKYSIKLGLEATFKSLKESFGKKDFNRKQLKEIVDQFESMKRAIDKNFDETFLEVITDSDINNFAENGSKKLYDDISKFILVDKFSVHGEKVLAFINQELPNQILAAFTEVLKTNSRVWLAYQRLILSDIQSNSRETQILSIEANSKLDVLAAKMEEIIYKVNKDDELEEGKLKSLILKTDMLSQYFKFSQNKLEEYFHDIKSQILKIEKVLLFEIETAGIERSEIKDLAEDHYEEFKSFKSNTAQRQEELVLMIENLKSEIQNSSHVSDSEMIDQATEKIELLVSYIEKLDLNEAPDIVKESIACLSEKNGLEKALVSLSLINIEKLPQDTEKESDDKINAFKLRIEMLKPRFAYSSIIDCYNSIIELYNSRMIPETRKNKDGTIQILSLPFVTKSQRTDLAIVYLDLGEIYRICGRYKDALEVLKKSTGLLEYVYGKEDSILAVNYSNMSLVYQAFNKYKKALKFQKKALKLVKDENENHRPLLSLYNNIGFSYNQLGKSDKALKYYFKAIESLEKQTEKKDSMLAVLYNNVASIYSDQKHLGLAIEYQMKDIELSKNILGNNHPKLATSYSNLGTIYSKNKEYKKAIRFHTKAVGIYERVFGEGHPDLVGMARNIVYCYKKMGDYENVIIYLKKAIIETKISMGKKHVLLQHLYFDLAKAYRKVGDPQTSLKMIEKIEALKKS